MSPLQPGSDMVNSQQREVYPDPRHEQFSQQTQAPLAAHGTSVQQPTETYVQPQQDQSFLGGEPAQQPGGLARQNSSSYRDWMAPAAVGVAGAGAGAAGYAAYQSHEQEVAVPPQQEETFPPRDAPAPETYQPSGFAAGPAAGVPANTATRDIDTTPTAFSTSDTADPAATISMPPPGETSTLGGLEREGAHETGHIFPKIIRHDTDMSVSKLHVPGEYPKGA